ncbi:MAG: nitroreductase [Spongiibacteraceae bacterium]|nr:nitroreductase [Spongiibacteraceae bacterium]
MNVSDALQQRRSTRAFLDTPVPTSTLKKLFQTAMQAPSNCNVQPWQVYVASGETRDRLSEQCLSELNSAKAPYPDIDWCLHFDNEQQQRKFESAATLYAAMGIDRNDKQARKQALIHNWEFFGAPHLAIVTMKKSLGLAGAVDLGIFAQSLVLCITEQGLACCFQASLNQFPGPVRKVLNIPDNDAIMFGLCFGYADLSAPVNTAKTSREPLHSLITFYN